MNLSIYVFLPYLVLEIELVLRLFFLYLLKIFLSTSNVIIFKKIGSSGSPQIQLWLRIILMVIAVQFVIDEVTIVLSEDLLNI